MFSPVAKASAKEQIGHRIEWSNPALAAGLSGAILRWPQSAKLPPYDRMIRMIRMTRRAGAAPMPGRCREASMPGWLQVYNNKAACSCPSSLSKFGGGTWTRNLDNCGLPCHKLFFFPPPDSRQALIPCASPRRKLELGQELGQGTWTNFVTCFPLTEPLVQVRLGNLDKELGQLRAAVLQALSVLRPDSRQAPIPCASFFRGRFPNGFYST